MILFINNMELGETFLVWRVTFHAGNDQRPNLQDVQKHNGAAFFFLQRVGNFIDSALRLVDSRVMGYEPELGVRNDISCSGKVDESF